jgi:hypothetical protein
MNAMITWPRLVAEYLAMTPNDEIKVKKLS